MKVVKIVVPVLPYVLWGIASTGEAQELAYDIGAIDRSLPFSVLGAKSHVNQPSPPTTPLAPRSGSGKGSRGCPSTSTVRG